MFETFLSPELLAQEFLGNSVSQYLYSLGVFVILLVLIGVFQYLILRNLQSLAKRTKTDVDDTFIHIIQSIRPPFYSFLAVYVALQFLTLYPWLERGLYVVLLIWIIYQAISAVQILLDFVFRKTLARGNNGGSASALSTIKNVLKGVLWAIGVLLILSNLGIDVSALIAGLGIGGVAVALAAQNILGDLFSSFAIIIDKPFEPGDFIVVGDHKGVVEKIGIKTTRIRALQGEEIVISNQRLTSTEIQNFKKMKERRVVFTFGVVYETPSNLLREIPGYVKGIIEKENNVRFDRSHFINFGDSALLFETVYFVSSGDYTFYADVHQKILQGINQAFEERKIVMAYPTQTVYIHKK